MKTYSETQGEPAFNWYKALIDARNGLLNVEELYELEHKAGSWVTCACGNQCNIIPRNRDGSPQDKELAELGLEFLSAVTYPYADYEQALEILHKIEIRSAKIIKSNN